jgi:hypothetical protein
MVLVRTSVNSDHSHLFTQKFSSFVLCVLCVVGLFSVVEGPCKRYVMARHVCQATTLERTGMAQWAGSMALASTALASSHGNVGHQRGLAMTKNGSIQNMLRTQTFNDQYYGICNGVNTCASMHASIHDKSL